MHLGAEARLGVAEAPGPIPDVDRAGVPVDALEAADCLYPLWCIAG